MFEGELSHNESLSRKQKEKKNSRKKSKEKELKVKKRLFVDFTKKKKKL